MLPERIPAASAISRTVVARKPFSANSSLAILTMSARRCDLTAPLAAGAAARLVGWLFRVGPIAPLLLASPQPPKRLLAFQDRLCRRRIARSQRGTCLIGERHGDKQLLASQRHAWIGPHQEPALEPAAALDQQLYVGALGQPRQSKVIGLSPENDGPVGSKSRR